jgi:hypothetical protein
MKPTALQELAVIPIVSYVILTHQYGLILHFTWTFLLDMHVNVDSPGLWHQQHSNMRKCVLSRTGYIITYCNCPIHWVSHLQTEIACSCLPLHNDFSTTQAPMLEATQIYEDKESYIVLVLDRIPSYTKVGPWHL